MIFGCKTNIARIFGCHELIYNRTGAGAAYGTAKSGIGIAGVGIYRPDLIMKVCEHVKDFDQILDSLTVLVIDSCGHGWYHCSLLASHRSPDRWSNQTTTRGALYSVQVRKACIMRCE